MNYNILELQSVIKSLQADSITNAILNKNKKNIELEQEVTLDSASEWFSILMQSRNYRPDLNEIARVLVASNLDDSFDQLFRDYPIVFPTYIEFEETKQPSSGDNSKY